MPRNVTVYISDELDEKMKHFGEVNWSEIARQGIERYMERRDVEVITKDKVPDYILREFCFYLETMGQYMQDNYTYSIVYIQDDFVVGITQREKQQFHELFRNLQEDYAELSRVFGQFSQTKNIDEFKPIFIKLMRIIDRYSQMITNFVIIVKENTSKVEPTLRAKGSRSPIEYFDETYEKFREKYNDLVMSFVKYASVTKNLHEQNIADHTVYRLLAPSLVSFRLSREKEKIE
jgi:hypothetical protein